MTGVLKGHGFITLKVPIFYYIDQDYLTLFFCMHSDLVSTESSGGTCNTYLRYIFFLLKGQYDDRLTEK